MKDFFAKEKIEAYALCPYSQVSLLRERKLAPLRKEWGSDPRWVLVFLAPYYVGEEEGNLSLYARSRDYHLYFEEVFSRLKEYLKQKGLPWRFYGFSDNSPINEVELAARCGLGVRGDHGLLIHPRYGSYVFIGELFFEEKPNLEVVSLGEPKGCSHCGACQRACPVGKIGERCLSELSQKKRLTEEEERLLAQHGILWGCDACQQACPCNKEASLSPLPFFWKERIPFLNEEILMQLYQEGLLEQRAFAWRGIQVLLRNLSLTL